MKKNAFCSKENYDLLNTDNKLIINLRDLGHSLRMLYEGKGSQRRILIILNEAESMTQHELIERIGIKPGSASEVIGKLEKADLIKRNPNPNDRRTAVITLTDKGKSQAKEAAEQRKTRHQEMFSCLSEEEKKELLTLTEKLNTDWNTRYHKIDDKFKHGKHHDGHKHHIHRNIFNHH